MNFYKHLITFFLCKRYKIKYQSKLFIHPFFRSIGSMNLVFSDDVHVHKDVLMDCGKMGSITLSRGVSINSYTRTEAENEVFLEADVLIGPMCYISDRNHSYQDVDIPIKNQGYFSRGGVKIGAGSWVGVHAAIIGNVTIGKHCVIGANAVITKDIPDYSIAVGNPAKVVKQYDFESKEWKKYNEEQGE